jgi:hypothetical protein
MIAMRILRTRGRLSRLAATMVVFVLVAGCNDVSSQDDGGSPTDTTSANTGGPDTPASTGGNGSDEGIAWVPFGPNDPKVPTPSWPAYNAFAAGKCSKLRDYFEGDDGRQLGESDYGKAMVAVCRAAVDGSQKQWAIAEDHVDADPDPLAHSCLAPLVTGLMNRAIAWHKEHPGRKPKVHIQRADDGTTDCGQKDLDAQRPPTEESPTPEETPTPAETPTTDETTESSG